MNFADAIDKSYVIRYDFWLMKGRYIFLTMLTNRILDIITKALATIENHFKIDLQNLKHSSINN